jgi:hypothetical protein
MHSMRVFFVLVAVVACSDPVHDRDVEALGPEKAGVAPGPLHRPGQPCLTCHGGQGPASSEMSFGGTVYALLGAEAPGATAVVRLLDAKNRTFDLTANCVGNFWIRKGDFGATFPLTAVATLGGFSRVMTTQMHRDGSCGGCHANPASAASPGHLWVLPEGTEPPDSTCSSDETTHGVEGVLPECTDTSQDCVAPFPTYTNDLAPILEANCVGCHQEGGQTPDPDLTTYRSVSALKTRITATTLVSQCLMPPPPLPPLSEADRKTFTCWVAGGAKR